MWKMFKQNSEKKEFQKVAKKQLKANIHVIKSLRDYDAGKKEISRLGKILG